MDDISGWLERYGLAEYEATFRDQEVRLSDLPLLSEDDLRELGLPLGPRKRLLAAVRALEPLAASETDSRPRDAPAFPSGSGAEHRQLSVMFCDLADSTALSERLELENYRDLLSSYQDAVRGAIAPLGGYIARYMGDGILVYFGYPSAHEDDAERAVRAGLAVVTAVPALASEPGHALAVRVGIATGSVLVGDIVGAGASEEHTVLGETPNLAARLQSLAARDTVLISDATRRLVEGRFLLDPLPLQHIKVLSEAVQCYQARAIRATSRFEAATARGLFNFVGRGGDLQLLQERWEQARAGEGQVVVLSGEPGIGKSRMLHELRQNTISELKFILAYQCSSLGAQTAFSPIIEQIQSAAALAREDTPEQKLDKLEQLWRSAGSDVSPAMPLLASLLELPTERYAPLNMSPQRQKLETATMLVDYVEQLSGSRPVMVLVEDAHWMDPSTLEVLSLMVERARTAPILIVITHRPEFECPWRQFGHVTQLSLNRLNRRDGKALSVQVAAGCRLPEHLLEHIVKHTDGVPLFIEELTKTLLEAGLPDETDEQIHSDTTLPPVGIPETLKDSLMARLDRLAPVREVAQAAACIGREFSADLLSRILTRPDLQADLEQLQQAGLIFQSSISDKQQFVFKHALVQDTAYESLLGSRRRMLHSRIAQELEAGEEADPGVLAQHYSAAGLAEEAAGNFLAAGKRALSVSALPEAGGELELGLREVQRLPDSTQRKRLELALRTALGAAKLAYLGWPHPSVGAAYKPAFDLAEELNDRQALGPILWGLCVHHWCRAEFVETHRWLSRLEDAADKLEDSEMGVVRDMTSGCQYFWEANYERAYAYTLRLQTSYDERTHGRISAYTNHDPLTFSLHWAGSLLQWVIGYPDRARELVDEAHALARRIGHPFNSAFALTAGSEALLMRGDTDRLLACCREAQEVVDQEALGDFAQHVLVDNWHGRTLIHAGDFEEGYRLTHRATNRWRTAGGKICSALFWGGEAVGLAGLGRVHDALELVDASLIHCQSTGDQFMKPEMLRLKAELLRGLPESGADESASLLREALETAQAHGARSWELRAATSLARLLQDDNRAGAIAVLEPILNWFTEGFDTQDVREATTLLKHLL